MSGVDGEGEMGKIAYAWRDGKVIDIGTNDINGTYCVVVEGHFTDFYCNLVKAYVNVGDAVKEGDALGEVKEWTAY